VEQGNLVIRPGLAGSPELIFYRASEIPFVIAFHPDPKLTVSSGEGKRREYSFPQDSNSILVPYRYRFHARIRRGFGRSMEEPLRRHSGAPLEMAQIELDLLGVFHDLYAVHNP
jgi:hypothetical protein